MKIDHLALSRPYAEAVFELALETKTLPAWSQFFERSRMIGVQECTQAFLKNPKISNDQKRDLFEYFLGEDLSPLQKNFLKLLAENDRLACLPEMADLYEADRANYETYLNVRIASVFPLSDTEKDRFRVVLEKHFNRSVRIETYIDETLLGGARIEAGDTVIDGTVSFYLNQLYKELVI